MIIEELAEGRLWVVRNAIPKTLCDHTALEYHMIKDVVQYQHPDRPLGDPTMRGAFSMYCPVCFEALGQYQQPLLEKLIGKKLHQTFSYGRIYVRDTELYPHRDRTSGEWVGNICISSDPEYDWAFYVDVQGKTFEVVAHTGDLIVFKGHEDMHWRHKYQGDKEQIQCFVSYVEQDGKYADRKWDGRPMLAAPWEAASESVRTEGDTFNYDPYYGPCEKNTGKDTDDEAMEELL